MTSQKLIIIGAGGHSRVVIDSAEACGLAIEGILDLDFDGKPETILGYPVLGNLEYLDTLDRNEYTLALAIGDCATRATHFAQSRKKGFQISTIVHPSAIISKHAMLGDGVFVSSGTVVNAEVEIGDNTIVNTRCIVEHEVKVGKHCHLGPGTSIAGRTRIGDYTVLGIGASVIDRITIGDHVIVGAGSTIIRDVEPGSKVAGSPARRI